MVSFSVVEAAVVLGSVSLTEASSVVVSGAAVVVTAAVAEVAVALSFGCVTVLFCALHPAKINAAANRTDNTAVIVFFFFFISRLFYHIGLTISIYQTIIII